MYDDAFSAENWAILPLHTETDKKSSFHLYQLRIRNCNEQNRDRIMQEIFEQDVAVNVHFIPLPCLTAYKKRGYNISNYPETWNKYSSEISLPVYYGLTDEQVLKVIDAVKIAVEKVMKS
jgi:dTDP-4-amino-4,6-dideoxygalactose transaminase